ncbi:hypothetical protein [Agathobaculum butyriciproducens]|uniref:hypothetical protein n=1 Tax=Agathobaculum butyriciproducens TaxID=1628085 RepID=UPI0036D22905
MKKFSIAMLSMVLAGSMLLTGCGGSKTADSSSDAQDSTTSTSADGGTLRMGTNALLSRRTSSLATTATYRASMRTSLLLSLTSWA